MNHLAKNGRARKNFKNFSTLQIGNSGCRFIFYDRPSLIELTHFLEARTIPPQKD